MNILKVLTGRRITGNIGEDAAVRHLRRNRYKILKRNFVAEGHEIDIIAKDSRHIVFVEVKCRTEDSLSPFEPRPAAAVDREKMRSIIKCARAYMMGDTGGLRMRFDVIEVIVDRDGKVKRLCHLEAAFTADRI